MYFNVTKCGFLVLCCLMSLSLSAKNAKNIAGDGSLRKPLCFVENKGQVMDQNNNPRSDIQYKLSAPGINLYLGNGQLHYQFKKVEGTPATDATITTYRMDMTLVGANPNAKVIADGKQDYYENYYLSQLGSNGFTAHSWSKITYKDVYPNIDWVLYIKGDKLEYDFNVRAGGRVSDIKLEYGGATALSVGEDGALAAETPMGRIREKKPFAFESASGKEVAANFNVKGNVVTFETGAYSGPLTIDPYVLWSTYFGGTADDVATSIAEDGASNTYVGGYAASVGLATGGSFMAVYQGGTFDAFLAKYNSLGVLQFATYVGGTGTDQGSCVAIESGTNNAYLGGTSTSVAAGLTTPGAYHLTNNGGNDGFLIKFNPLGVRIWCTFYGGTGNESLNSVATDPLNNVFVTGQTASTVLISSIGAYQTARSGPNDAFLAKFDASGTVQWSTYYGGSTQEQALGVKCSAAGDVYITGQTNSVTSMSSTGSYQPALSGPFDAFIAKFSTAGTRDWGTFFGGTNTEQGNAIAVDPVTGNVAVIGNTNSLIGVASPLSHQTTMGGIQDGFLALFNDAGARLWSTYYGGTSVEYGQGVCFDGNGHVIIAGGTFSPGGISNAGSMQPAIGGDYDAFISKFNQLGQRLWGTYLGGSFYDYASGVAVDNNNQIAVAGHTSSLGLYGSGGIVTSSAAQLAYGGGIHDAFVARLTPDTIVTITQPYTDTLVCAGGQLNVSYTVYPFQFAAGNIFTVQLSDAVGSFASPVNIGSVAAITSGVVTCTIPAITPLGTNYRIRIVASNPAYTSPNNHVNIQVVASIAATVASSNSPVCVGGIIRLYNTAPYSVSSYSWSGPAGFVSALQNPTRSPITLAHAGTYSVTTVHNGCPSSMATVTVDVNDFVPPTPIATASYGCAGSTLSLFADPDTTAPSIQWLWVGPGGFSSTMQNPTIPVASTSNTGFYFAQDTISGCPSAQAMIYVVINPVLPTAISIQASPGHTPGAPGDTVCQGTLVTFIAFPINGGSTPSYQWMIGSTPVVGAIANIWASSTLMDGMDVHCLLTSSVDCPLPAVANSNTIKMNVISHAPIVYIYATPGLHVPSGSSVTFHSAVYDAGLTPKYQWIKNGAMISGATNTSYTFPSVTNADTITLQVISTMECTADTIGISNPLIVMTNVGVANVAGALDNITLFPNPNSGSFSVKGQLNNTFSNSTVSLDVSNLLGQSVYSSEATIQNNELNQSVNIGNLASGIYLLRISHDGDSKVFRFSVQR